MTDHPPPAKKRSWLPCGCLLFMFAVCVVVPVLFFMIWAFRASSQVNTQVTRIREAGLPTNTEELAGYYQIEGGAQDATTLYLAAQEEFSGRAFEVACQGLPIIGNSELEIPRPGQPWAQQEAVESFLDDYQRGLEIVHEAVAIGGAAQFPLEFERGFEMLLPQTQEMRTCARMLALEAHVRAHQGDANGTADSLFALGTIGKSLENQPIIVSQLVHVAIKGMAVDLTRQLLPHVDFSDEDLVRLQQVFRQDDFKAGLARSLAGERAMGSEFFKNPATAMGPGSGLPQNRFLRGSNEDLALYLEIQTDLHEATELPYPDALDGVAAAHAKLLTKISTPFGRMRYIMTAMVLPAVASAAGAAARGDGADRCIDAAIAVERFRRRNGKLPATLTELVPEYLPAVPIDPFDGKPVRYIVRPDAYLIYTCGINRLDDGGLEDQAMTDAVVRVDLKSAQADAPPAESPE